MQIDALIDLLRLRNSVYNESPNEIELAEKLCYRCLVEAISDASNFLSKETKTFFNSIATDLILKYIIVVIPKSSIY